MRIDLGSFNPVGSSQESSAAAQHAATRSTSDAGDDGVKAQLSSDSKAVSNLTLGDDIRHDRVATLRQAIESGTYEVNAGGVAAAMLDNMSSVRFTV